MTEPPDRPSPPAESDLARAVDALLEQLVALQERRLFALGRRLHPGLSRDDLHNFDDVPALAGNPHFAYEDGHYAGLLAAQAALRALLRSWPGQTAPGPDGPRSAIFRDPDDRPR